MKQAKHAPHEHSDDCITMLPSRHSAAWPLTAFPPLGDFFSKQKNSLKNHSLCSHSHSQGQVEVEVEVEPHLRLMLLTAMLRWCRLFLLHLMMCMCGGVAWYGMGGRHTCLQMQGCGREGGGGSVKYVFSGGYGQPSLFTCWCLLFFFFFFFGAEVVTLAGVKKKQRGSVFRKTLSTCGVIDGKNNFFFGLQDMLAEAGCVHKTKQDAAGFNYLFILPLCSFLSPPIPQEIGEEVRGAFESSSLASASHRIAARHPTPRRLSSTARQWLTRSAVGSRRGALGALR